MAEIEKVQSGTELARYESPSIVQFGTMRMDGPQAVIQQAATIAKELARLVEEKKLFTLIRGKKHLQVEAWTTMGAMLGIVPVEDTVTRFPDGGYEASVNLIRASDGQRIGRGSSVCGMDEPTWAERPEYARRSMAITRATGKAYRLGFAWIMVLAGFEPTPSEEMPGEEAHEYKGHLYLRTWKGQPVTEHDLEHGSAEYCVKCQSVHAKKDTASSAAGAAEAGSSSSSRPTPPAVESPHPQPGDDLHLTASDVPQNSQKGAVAAPDIGDWGKVPLATEAQLQGKAKPMPVGEWMTLMEQAKKPFAERGVGEIIYRKILKDCGFTKKSEVKTTADRDRVYRKLVEAFTDLSLLTAEQQTATPPDLTASDAWTSQMLALSDQDPVAFKKEMGSLGYRTVAGVPVEFRLGVIEAMRLVVR